MSGARVREAAERLRAKYSRVFDVPLEQVTIEHFEHEDGEPDARITSGDLDAPIWTVGARARK